MTTFQIDEMKTVLSADIEECLAIWHVPGLALAVVKDGQTIHCAGYGLRDTSRSLPVTPQTLFPIASCTKAFTALACGMLVDVGKLEWDRPVITYLPDLKLWDAFAASRINARDLLSHRSGLPGHDMMWYATRFSRQEIFERLRFLEPTGDLRTTFQYQNLMYMVAGLVVEAVSGISWQKFIQHHILNPLGMNRTGFSTVELQKDDDFALPYRLVHGTLLRMAFQEEMDGEKNPLAGAGGIISCVSDISIWLKFLLDGGKFNGQALVSQEVMDEILSPQIFTADTPARINFGYEFNSYGLGWGLRSHKGKFLAEHDGMADGFYSLVSMMAREGVGMVALSNADSYYNPVQENLVPNITAYTLYDRLLNLDPWDWNGRLRRLHDERQQAMQQAAGHTTGYEQPHGPPCHPIEEYLGDYVHPGYGRASIRQEGSQLQLVLNEKLVLPLFHCYFDVFEIYFELMEARQKISFSTNLEGKISQIAVPIDPPISPILFSRVQE